MGDIRDRSGAGSLEDASSGLSQNRQELVGVINGSQCLSEAENGTVGAEESEQMLAEERDLADDAPWKRIQQNTFTRWVNEHLKKVDKNVDSLNSDLENGLMLIALIEVLSCKRMPRHNKKPFIRSQKLENVSVALRFLEKDENIKIVNIDSSHIVDSQLKLILGLIWTLILHYSISMPMWDGEESQKTSTPKQRLMEWVQSKLADMPVKNFTSDWGDGKAIGALVDGVAPGLCPEWSDWVPEDALRNTKEAMTLADDWLGIPQLIRPEDMIDPNVDDLSMMTYLSQYPKAKLKPNAPLRPRSVPNRVRCYGPGVEPSGCVVDAAASFTVESEQDVVGAVHCVLHTPDGTKTPIDVVAEPGSARKFSCCYLPKSKGRHMVRVVVADREVAGSPFHVLVCSSIGDADKVTVSGPGVELDGVIAGQATFFNIFTKEAGLGQPEVVILDSEGKEMTSSQLTVDLVTTGQYRCHYTPSRTGLHSVNVFFASALVNKSPFGVNVRPENDAGRVRVSGRGVQQQGVRCGDRVQFRIATDGAGTATPSAEVIGPGGVKLAIQQTEVTPNTYEVSYIPENVGRHVVMVLFDGKEVPNSPFEVNVAPKKESRIRCFGAGLAGGRAGRDAAFVVDSGGESGALGFNIAGPSRAVISCHDNGDGSALVTYRPTAAGEYAVHVLCDDEDVPHSPWMANIVASASADDDNTDLHPEKVVVSGDGVSKGKVVEHQTTEFSIDTSQAGSSDVEVQVVDTDLRAVPHQVSPLADGLRTVHYTPTTPGKHFVQVTLGGEEVPGSPFCVKVAPAAGAAAAAAAEKVVVVRGPADGANGGALVPNTPYQFEIDASKAGAGAVTAQLRSLTDGSLVPISLTRPDNDRYVVESSFPCAGHYALDVSHAGVPVSGSPLEVEVIAGDDLLTAEITGLTEKAFVNSPVDFCVNTASLPVSGDRAAVRCVVREPDGSRLAALLEQQQDATHSFSFVPTKEGEHTLDVYLSDKPVAGSRRSLTCVSGNDVTRVLAYGDGLKRALLGQPASFTVNTRGAGVGGLSLAVEGPSESVIKCDDRGDGTCAVQYTVDQPGLYDVFVKFDCQNIPGSPFQVRASGDGDASAVTVSGPGLDSQTARAGETQCFTVDASRAAPASISVNITGDQGELLKMPVVDDNADGTYTVQYTVPAASQSCLVAVKHAEQHIPGSPFRVDVQPVCESVCQSNSVTVAASDSAGLRQKHTSFPLSECDGDSVSRQQQLLEEAYGGHVTSVNGTRQQAHSPVHFADISVSVSAADLTAEIVTPSGAVVAGEVRDCGSGKVAVTFQPTEPGEHRLAVKHRGQHVQGSPFTFVVEPLREGEVTAEGPGLERAVAGESATFTVHTKDAPAGGLSLALEGPSRAQLSCRDNGDATMTVHYLPLLPGQYYVTVKFADRHIAGSPFAVTVTDDGRKRSQVSLSNQSQVSCLPSLSNTVSARDINTLTATVRSPSGLEEPGFLQLLPNDHMGLSFTPREVGEHWVHVRRGSGGGSGGGGGGEIAGSPFRVEVTPEEVGDAGRVRVYGEALRRGQTHCHNQFCVDTSEAGFGGLSMSIEGPSKAEITCDDRQDGKLLVSYNPKQPGDYKLNLKFADHHVEGSPFLVEVGGEGCDNQVLEQVQLERAAVSPSGVGSTCAISFKMADQLAENQQLQQQQLSASVTAPSGAIRPAEVCALPEPGAYSVQFTASELGVHTVAVRQAGAHIPGSPFQFTVGPLVDGGAHRVKAMGPGLQRGRQNVVNEFDVWSREAGAGALAISVEGPSKAEIEFQERPDGCCYVGYLVTEPGEYCVGIKFNDDHIPDSPFKVYVAPHHEDADKIVLANLPTQVAEAGVPVLFEVITGAVREPGGAQLESRLVAPDGSVDDCFLAARASDATVQTGRCVPRHCGSHQLHVTCGGAHVPGSPHHFQVGSPATSASAAKCPVRAYGDGLSRGATNEQASFVVDTCSAEPGSLSVTVDGPSQSQLTSSELANGFLVTYVATCPGNYVIGVKYNGQHIADSPFTASVTGDEATSRSAKSGHHQQQQQQQQSCLVMQSSRQSDVARSSRRSPGGHGQARAPVPLNSDVTRVLCHGDGLHRPRLGENSFVVDTSQAGEDILWVGCYATTAAGPSCRPCDEVGVQHQQAGRYLVKYRASVRGTYLLMIRWGDSDIPGSPFEIEV